MSTSSSATTPWLQNLFGVDVHSLALFRVVLGVVLFCTLASSFCDLGALYTDSGVAPRSWVMELGNSTRLSLYFLNGSVFFAVILLLIQSVAALMLIVGWRTRLASVISFMLWASLMSRNPAAWTPGDSMIAGLLFWSMFLPLGTLYSADNALTVGEPPAQTQILSWATAGLLVQAISPYFFSTLAAYAAPQPHESMTLYYALNLDQYANAAGHWMLSFPHLLATLSRLFFGLSLIAPLLIFSPILTQTTRFLALLGFLSVQVFVLLFLDAGALPWACIAALCVFPGASIWEFLKRRDERRNAGTLRIYYDRDHSFSRAMCLLLQEFLILPRAQILEAQETPRTRSLLQANHSWVVLDANDQATMKWAALVTLLKCSPLLGLPGRLLSANFWEKPGNVLYDALARRRTSLDRLSTRLLSKSRPDSELGWFWRWLSAAMLVVILLWSFSGVHWLPRPIGEQLAPALEILSLDRPWTLYSASTLENDGWLMAPARLTDGTELDVLHPDHNAPNFSKLTHAVIAADGLRWISYRNQIWTDDSAGQRRLYARYLCRSWNTAHAGDVTKQMTQLSFIYMLERTPLPGPSPQIEQRILSSHECPVDSSSGFE